LKKKRNKVGKSSTLYVEPSAGIGQKKFEGGIRQYRSLAKTRRKKSEAKKAYRKSKNRPHSIIGGCREKRGCSRSDLLPSEVRGTEELLLKNTLNKKRRTAVPRMPQAKNKGCKS